MAEAAYAALALVLVSLMLLGATVVADEGLDRSGKRIDIVDEEFKPQGQTGQFITLNNSNSDQLTYAETVIVKDRNANHSIEDDDYVWNATNGTIKPLAGGNLDGDNKATISYTFWNPTERDTDVAETIAVIVSVGMWIPLLILIALVVMGLMLLGGLG